MGVMLFLSKNLLNTQCRMGWYARKSPIMKWANTWNRVFKTNSRKANSASHNNTSWYTDTDGLLDHSPSGESL